MSDYTRLAHAMQTGVAIKMEFDQTETSPKHLRVGVNAAMCDAGGLVRLLIAKGLITAEEYERAITDEMRREVERYESWLRERGLPNVHLG